MAVVVEQNRRTLSITWDSPPLNVLDIGLLRELDQALISCAEDSSIDVVLLQGAGDRAFSAGVDIKDHTSEKVPQMLEVMHGVIRKLLTLPQATIALVRGVCLGGGCEVASSCDFIVAAEESTFATPEIIVGCYPPVALARFSQLIGYHRAAEMILTGRRFSAREAQVMGLINRVFAINELDNGIQALLDELLGKSGAVDNRFSAVDFGLSGAQIGELVQFRRWFQQAMIRWSLALTRFGCCRRPARVVTVCCLILLHALSLFCVGASPQNDILIPMGVRNPIFRTWLWRSLLRLIGLGLPGQCSHIFWI